VGDFNTPLFSIDKMSRQKINKGILELNNTFDKMDLAGICRVFHPTTADYTFFSAAHRTFSKIEHNLDHKTNLNKYKRIETIHCLLTDHNGIKLEIDNKENYKNIQTHGVIDQHTFDQQLEALGKKLRNS
jgi:hypothetical protein